jgi:predicted nucleotidyltransferase
MPVQSLAELRQLKPQIEAIASQYGLRNLRVFGSIVRGEMTATSDIDLLAEYPEQDFSYFDLFHCQEDIERLVGRRVEIVHPAFIRYPEMRNTILHEARSL